MSKQVPHSLEINIAACRKKKNKSSASKSPKTPMKISDFLQNIQGMNLVLVPSNTHLLDLSKRIKIS